MNTSRRAGSWLIEDFLLHEVLELTLLGALRVERYGMYWQLDRLSIERLDRISIPPHGHYLAALQKGHLARMLDDRRQVRGQEHLALPYPDCDPARIPDPAGHQPIRFAGGEGDDGVRPAQQVERLPRRFFQAVTRVQKLLDEMRSEEHTSELQSPTN